MNDEQCSTITAQKYLMCQGWFIINKLNRVNRVTNKFSEYD